MHELNKGKYIWHFIPSKKCLCRVEFGLAQRKPCPPRDENRHMSKWLQDLLSPWDKDSSWDNSYVVWHNMEWRIRKCISKSKRYWDCWKRNSSTIITPEKHTLTGTQNTNRWHHSHLSHLLPRNLTDLRVSLPWYQFLIQGIRIHVSDNFPNPEKDSNM